MDSLSGQGIDVARRIADDEQMIGITAGNAPEAQACPAQCASSSARGPSACLMCGSSPSIPLVNPLQVRGNAAAAGDDIAGEVQLTARLAE